MNRPLIIGQAPSRLSDPNEPLSGRSGRRLAALAGLSIEEFCAQFERRNLCSCGPFTPRFAAISAEVLRPLCHERYVVLLGAPVARAFGLIMEPLEVRDVDDATVGMCPHPSGLNRWWNDPENVEDARAFWTAIAILSQQ